MRPLPWLAVVAVISSLAAQPARSAPIAFNGHSYEYVSAPLISWTGSQAAASSLSFGGEQGYLATLTTPEENAFVTSLLPYANDTAAYLGGIQLDTSGGHADGWAWITGEPWSYTAWGPVEPNGFNEEYLCIWFADQYPYRVRGAWNDGTNSGALIGGYVVEFNAVPEAAPSSLLAL